MDLEITEVGTGGPRVVFVHGVLDRGRSFARVAKLLAGECRVAWYDRRGYGASVYAAAEPVGWSVHVDDVLRVLDGRPAVVVGHSFGGVPALGAAVRAPELVQALALYETGLAWVPGWDDTAMAGVLADVDPETAGLRLMFRERYDQMSEPERERWRREARAFVAEERSVRDAGPPFDTAAVRAPVVYGRSSPDVVAAVVAHLRATVPNVEEVTIPGAGHNAHRTQPRAFADLVRRALALASR